MKSILTFVLFFAAYFGSFANAEVNSSAPEDLSVKTAQTRSSL